MEVSQYAYVLDNMPLFKSFSSEKLLEFFQTQQYQISSYSRGSMIFLENETCSSLNIILDGVVQVQKIDSFGKSLTVVQFQKGDTLGENLLFGSGNAFPMTITAVTDAIILKMPKEAVLKLCQEDAAFLAEFLKLLSDKALTLSIKLKQVTLKTIRQKICEVIFEAYRKQNKSDIDLGMSRKELADRLGVQRPSLSRELINMKAEGLIDFDRRLISIKDLEAIKAFI